MLAIPKAARSLILSSLAGATMLLAGGAAQALPTDATGYLAATPEAGLLLAHAQDRGKHAWKQHGKPRWRHDGRDRGRRLHRKFRDRHSGYRGHGPRHRACHLVKRVGFHHGYKVLLGGIRCYDRHGRAYVLRGSRHILRYLHR